MKFMLLSLIVAAAAAIKIEESLWKHSASETLRTTLSYKQDMKFTYAYETVMKILNPLVPNQFVGIKLQALVHLDFLPGGSGFHKVRMTITKPMFNTITLGSEEALPIERYIPILETVKEELPRGFTFDYKDDGRVIRVFYHDTESLWSINIKKGIVSMLNVNVLIKQRTVEERSLHGICKSVYTIDDSMQWIWKTINTSSCRTSLKHEFPTITPESETAEIKMKYELHRTPSSFKIIHVTANETTFFYPLGNLKNEAIRAVTNQTLRLIKETIRMEKIILPVERQTDSIVARFHHQSLLVIAPTLEEVYALFKNLAFDIANINAPFTPETTIRVTELVHALRALKPEQMQLIWDKYVNDFNTRINITLFIRVFSLVKTKESMTVFFRQMNEQPTSLPKHLIDEYLYMLSTTQNVERKMIQHIEEICELPIVMDNKRLRHTCFLTFVTLRKTFCQWSHCKKNSLPKDLIKNLKLATFTSLTEEEMLNHLIIAESAVEPELVSYLLEIIKYQKLPLHVRTRAVLALKPLVVKMETKLTGTLFKVFRWTELPEEIRMFVFSVLLERPTPSVIRACVPEFLLEKSLTMRKFMYDMIKVLPELPLPKNTLLAADMVLNFLRTRRYASFTLKWFQWSFVKVNSPLPGLVWKNLVLYGNKTLLPRFLATSLDMNIQGKQYKLLDVEVRTDGVDNFVNKLLGLHHKDEQLQLFTRFKLFGNHWSSMYKSVSEHVKPTKDFFYTFLPERFEKLRSWVQTVEEGLNFQTTRIVMPFETVRRIPTIVGIPLVYNLTSTVIHHAKSSFTATIDQSYWNILFQRDMDVTAEFINKQRLMWLLRGSFYFETPFMNVGIHHNIKNNVTFENQINITYDLQTNNFTKEIKLPDLTEVLTTQSDSEMFIWRPTVSKNIQSYETFSLLEYPLPYTKENYTNRSVYLAVEQQSSYKYIKSFGWIRPKVHVSSSIPWFTWTVVPVSSNIISLYSPQQNKWISVDPSTHEFTLSQTNRTYFFVDYTRDGRMLMKTLVQSPKWKPQTSSPQQDALDLLDLLREAGVDNEQWKEMDDTLLARTLKIKHVVVDKNIVRLSEAQPTPILIMKLSSCKKCMCIRTIARNFTRNQKINSIFIPVIMKASFETDVKGVMVSLVSIFNDTDRDVTITSSQITFVGREERFRTFDFNITTDLKKSRFDLEIQSFEKKRICVNAEYTKDSLAARLAFGRPTCETVLSLSADKSGEVFGDHLNFTWAFNITHYFSVNGLISLNRPEIMEKERIYPQRFFKFGFNLIKWKERNARTLDTSYNVLLLSPTTARVIFGENMTVDVKRHFPFEIILPGWYRPQPPTSEPITVLSKPFCTHRGNFFQTFDRVDYNFEMPNEKCEHVLVQNCNGRLPKFMISIRKHQTTLRGLRIVLKESEYNIIPRSVHQLPRIWHDGEWISVNRKMELPNKMHLKFLWIPESKVLLITNYELGLEVKLVESREVYTRMSPLLTGMVCGMCGNMDYRKDNELRYPGSFSKVDSLALFGMSWLVPFTGANECPLDRKITPQRIKGYECRSLIKLPTCSPSCKPIKTFPVSDIRFKCQDVTRGYRRYFWKKGMVDVPTDCECRVDY